MRFSTTRQKLQKEYNEVERNFTEDQGEGQRIRKISEVT